MNEWTSMGKKILTSFWLIYALIAVVIVVAQYQSAITVLSVLAYLTVFLPYLLVLVIAIWHSKLLLIGLTLILVLTQSIKAVALGSWLNTLTHFVFNPPISLAFLLATLPVVMAI